MSENKPSMTDAQYLQAIAKHYEDSPVAELRAHRERILAISANLTAPSVDAALTQEPVAWVPYERPGEYHHSDFINASRSEKSGWVPVFATPQPAASVASGGEAAIERFDITTNMVGQPTMVADSHGEYVRYLDHIANIRADILALLATSAPAQQRVCATEREAFAAYLKDCDEHAIVPDVAGAFHACWAATAPLQPRTPEHDAEWIAERRAAIKLHHTHDFGDGPVLHPDCIGDALRQGLAAQPRTPEPSEAELVHVLTVYSVGLAQFGKAAFVRSWEPDMRNGALADGEHRLYAKRPAAGRAATPAQGGC